MKLASKASHKRISKEELPLKAEYMSSISEHEAGGMKLAFLEESPGRRKMQEEEQKIPLGLGLFLFLPSLAIAKPSPVSPQFSHC